MAKAKTRKSEAQLECEEEIVRTNLGIYGAMSGDESDARRLAFRLQSELSSIAFLSNLPEPVRRRFDLVAQAVRDLQNFMEGRVSALPKKPNAKNS